MEAKQHPQRVRMQELKGELQRRNQAYAALERIHDKLKTDHMTINTLPQLKISQLDTTLQANQLLEARASSASSSYTRSTSKEQELAQYLSLQK